MNKQLATSLTGYLATLTTKLTSLIKGEKIHKIQQITDNDESFIDKKIESQYKKLDQWNFLQYFEYILNLQQTKAIKLQKQAEPFTLKEDLHILMYVSKNPHKIPVKALQQMSKSSIVYGKNNKGLNVKRNLKRILQRFRFLEKTVADKEIECIVKWIQENGLDTSMFLQQNQPEQRCNTQINIKIVWKSPLHNDFLLNKINTKINKAQQSKRKQPLPTTQHKQVQGEAAKKIKHNQQKNSQENLKINQDKNFTTPQKKIVLVQPGAPQKKKLQLTQDKNSKEIKKKPKRKFLRIIDAKKDVFIREEETIIQEKQQKKINSPPYKIGEQNQKVSKFKVETEQDQIKSEQSIQSIINPNNQQESKQECLQLESILQRFKNQTKFTEIRILKFLDQVSGDLNDLKTYLETQNSDLLWKRLEDSILRSYYRNGLNIDKNRQKSESTVVSMYDRLLKKKGEKRVNKRIEYLAIVVKQEQ